MVKVENLAQGTILKDELNLPVLVEGFLTDRRAAGLANGTVTFYKKKLSVFLRYCQEQKIAQATELTPDVIRRFLLQAAENHNAGGAHAFYRTIRALLRWAEFEDVTPDGWKNPIRRVKAPRVTVAPIEGANPEDVLRMVETCAGSGANDYRDRAILFALMDTGARATEFLNMNIADLNIATGAILIRQGKGKKPRMVYIGRRTRKAVRAYARTRTDDNTALWVSDEGDRLTYGGLRAILKRRANLAGLADAPSPHDYRRCFALEMLRNGTDVFTLQRLLGHADLQVLRRYLAQTDEDGQKAHAANSPVDRTLDGRRGIG